MQRRPSLPEPLSVLEEAQIVETAVIFDTSTNRP
jgi:hypothetical protein